MKMTVFVVLWSSYTYVPVDTGICIHTYNHIYTNIHTYLKIITTSIVYALLIALFMLKTSLTEIAGLG